MTRFSNIFRRLLPLALLALAPFVAVAADSADSTEPAESAGLAESPAPAAVPDATVHRTLVAAAEQRSRETAAGLVPTVLSIFERSCADCHDSARARPKGGFGNIMDLAAIREDSALLVPGEPMESELYLLITDPDPEFKMPPPDSEHPQLTRVESRLVEQWILGGAPASVDFYEESEEENGEKETEEKESAEAADEASIEPPAGASFDPTTAFAKAHPVFVHFPIGLLAAGILAQVLRLVGLGGDRLTFAARWCLWLGAAGSLFAASSGWLNVSVAGHSDDAVFLHRWSGVTVVVLSLVVVVCDLWRTRDSKRARAVFLILLLALLAVLFFAGHTGGELVYGKGYFSIF